MLIGKQRKRLERCPAVAAPTRGTHPDAMTGGALASLGGRAERQHFDELGPCSSQRGRRRLSHDLLIDDRDDRAKLGHGRVCVRVSVRHDTHTIGPDRSFDYSVVWGSRDGNVGRSKTFVRGLRDEFAFSSGLDRDYLIVDRSMKTHALTKGMKWGKTKEECGALAGAGSVIVLATFRLFPASSRSL